MSLLLGLFLATLVGVQTARGAADFPLQEQHQTLNDLSIDCKGVDECEDPPGRGRKICGTNGKTFQGVCAFSRAYCKDGNVQFKKDGECSASEKCLGEKRTAELEAKKSKGIFIPDCKPDGTYTAIQCHTDTGYCWCMSPMGDVVRNTVTNNVKPDCENLTKWIHEDTPTMRPLPGHPGGCTGSKRRTFNKNMLKEMIKEYKRDTKNSVITSDHALKRASLLYKFETLDTRKDNQLRRSEYKGMQNLIKKSLKPRKCAKKFPKFCDLNADGTISQKEWIKCFTSHGDIQGQGDRIVKKSKENRGNKFARQEVGAGPVSNEFARPEVGAGPVTKPRPCDHEKNQSLDNNDPNAYIPKCDRQGKYRPVQCYGSNATDSWYCFCVNVETGDMIENTSMRYETPNCWPKCPPPYKEKKFLQALKSYLVVYTRQRLYKKKDPRAAMITEDNVIEKFFKYIDKNGNNFIERKEKRALKKSISRKRNRKVWTCGRKIHIVCDSNADGKISLHEFYTCVTPSRGHQITNESYVPKPKFKGKKDGKNPFIEYIQSE